MKTGGPARRPSSFEVDVRTHGEAVQILAVRGELDLSTAPAFEQPLEAALSAEPDPRILVDLSDCEFIDSTGIAIVVRAWQRLEQSPDGRFAVCGAARQVQRVLQISGVGASIPIYADADAALAQLDGAAPVEGSVSPDGSTAA